MPSRSFASLASSFLIAISTSFSIVPMATADHADSKPKEVEGKHKKIFEELLKDYQAYGLPMPPKGAKLVRFPNGWRSYADDGAGKETIQHHLGFLLEAGDKKRPPRLLVGTKQFQSDREEFEMKEVEPKVDAAKDFFPCNTHWPFEMNCGLAVAIQCKARGWDDLAQHLLEVSLKEDCGHPYGGYYQPSDLPPRQALAHLALVHWANEIVEPNADGAMIAKRLKALYKANPTLDSRRNRYLLDSLEKALVPSKAKPGSVDALIDELADFSGKKKSGDEKATSASPYDRLEALCFEAVPGLIEHLEDERLTHHIKDGFNNFPTWHQHVQHVVSELLEQIAGDDMNKNWLDRQHGYAVAKADAQAWWEKAQKTGEEKYLVEYVLPTDPKRKWPNETMLKRLAKKYPKHLPKLYATLLEDRPWIVSHPLAKALANSALPYDEKAPLLIKAFRGANEEHRLGAFWALHDLDKDRFLDILEETLDKLPKSPTEPCWTCPEAKWATLVGRITEPRAWAALTRAAKRSDVGLRMEILSEVCRGSQAKEQIAFLASFLDDESVRDIESNPKMHEGLHAGYLYPRLEVRNFAAMKLAEILKVKAEPKRDWGEGEWKKLREQLVGEMKK
ncbi:MAG: hypothetical protein ACJ8FY_23250 [Gemmataceae bacterium]